MKVIDLFKFIERRLLPGLGVALFTLSVAWMLFEALSRQLLHRSYAISEEVVMFSLAWAVFLTLAQSGREKYHIATDLVIRLFPSGIRRVVGCITLLISIFYGIIITVSGLRFIPHLHEGQIISSSPLQVPMWVVFFAVPIGGVLLALFYLETLVGNLIRWREEG